MVVEAIRSAEVVFTSSLHALIIAESFGTPCVWVSIGEGLIGGDHKFLDYFEGSGRTEGVCAVPLDAAVRNPNPLPPAMHSNARLLEQFTRIPSLMASRR